MSRHLRTTLAFTCAVVATLDCSGSVRADFGGGAGASAVCPGGTAPWQGTQLGPAGPVELHSEQEITCHVPQVSGTTGSPSHSAPGGPPPDGTTCTEHLTGAVQLGPVAAGKRPVTYYEPNQGQAVTQTVPDDPSDAGYTPTTYTANLSSLWGASAFMGSYDFSIPWTLNGTFVAGQCSGQWQPDHGTRCPTTCYPVPTPLLRPPLTFQGAPASLLQPLIDRVRAQFTSNYSGGHVTSQWASGGYAPQTGEVVRTPVCFWEDGAIVPPTVMFGMTDPQPGTGPSLVVSYVIRATTEEIWWDFGDGQVSDQLGSTASQQCAVQHTYYHVSADAYGSGTRHMTPPGVAWTYGTEPGPDMEAVAMWRRVRFSVTAYYQEPDGTQQSVDLPVGPQAVAWIGSSPEWVRVYQIESSLTSPTPSPSAAR